MTSPTAPFDDYEDISGLEHNAWCAEIDDHAEELGYFEQLGMAHAAAFTEGSDVLLVSFTTRADAQAHGPKGYPAGFAQARCEGWSSLTLIAHNDCDRAPWFRCPSVVDFFDRLIDDGFFDDYDRVAFYGEGPCGYAAAAYSVAAPGATVIALAPQATLDGRLASWDRRFPQTKRLDFSTRYGFAPHMIDGAERAFVFYDPAVREDAMHAALFHRPNVTLRPVRHTRGAIVAQFARSGISSALITAAMTGTLDTRGVTQAQRARRDDIGYLRTLLGALAGSYRPMLTALLCRWVVARRPGARHFARTLDLARTRLDAEGRALPDPATVAE